MFIDKVSMNKHLKESVHRDIKSYTSKVKTRDREEAEIDTETRDHGKPEVSNLVTCHSRHLDVAYI